MHAHVQSAVLQQSDELCSIGEHCSVCLYSLKGAAMYLLHLQTDIAMLVGPNLLWARHGEHAIASTTRCISLALHHLHSPTYMQGAMTMLLPRVHAQ